METLFRKLRESASSFKRSSTSSNSPERSHHHPHHAPLGLFDSLPSDLLLKIIRLLDPKHAAKLCIVCKSWRSLVSDNQLWSDFLQNNQPLHYDSIIFSETKLTSGYPLPFFVTQTPRVLSFKHVYGQRERLPPAVIIDGGSGYCKFGWSKEDRPLGRTATFLEFGNVETPIYSRLRHFFGTVYGRMKVKPSSQAVVVSLPICHYDDTESARASRQQLKEAICAALFDLNVPAVCALNQATLALYAAKQTSGISVNIGFQVTSVVPILNGKVMRKVGVEVVGLGALKLTGFLREKMQQNSLNFESLYTVRTLKEKLCYVAYDYEAELLKDTQASFEAGEGRYTLSKERFQTGEILFQPRLAGVRAMSLHQATALCMDHCYSAELAGGSDWFKTIVLSGGSACLPGLAGICLFFILALFIFASEHEDELKPQHGIPCYGLPFSNSTFGIICFRKVREGTSFVTSPYVEWNQSHPSSTWRGYCMVWCKAYWQFEHISCLLVYNKEAVPSEV